MTTAPERPRARRSAGDLLRAGAALSVLAALLIGVPWALPALTGPLLPAGVPAGDAVAAALTSPDAGALVRLLPVLAAWAAWAAFTACVAAEIAAQARNRPTPRLPGLRWGQVAAAKLVPAVAVGLGRGAGLADVVPASEAILAATPVEAAATGARTGAPAAAADAGEPADDPGTYTTRRHDTYIGIAQEQLGDRARYSEIIDLNVGREMPDGTVLTGEEFLEPGWPLLLPTDDRDEDDPAEEGDEDGDPDGAEPPAPDGARRTGAGAPAPASPAAAGTGANAAPDRRGNRRRRTEPTGEKTDQAVPAVKVAGYSAPLAVGLLGLLDARRLLQQRRRRPGHRIVQPTDDALVAAEETMRHAADPAGVGLLDQALRSLAARAARTGRPLPPLLGARVTPRDCELLLAAEDEDETGAEPLAPFQAVDGCTWRLDPGDEALLGRGEAAAVPGPCPGLVTLGRDAAGAHLFVDLTRAAAVNLTGAPEHVREVLTALALELAASAWAGRIGVTAVGFGDELPALLRTDRPDRLRHTGTVSACLDRIELLARDLHDGAEQGEERPTEIILSARPIARGDLRRLRDIASAAPDLPLGIVAAAGDDRHLPTDWTLDAAPEAVVTLPGTERTVLLQRMTAEQSDQVAAVLGAAARTRSAPAEGWEAVPPEPDGADADAEEERPHDPADPADPEEERTDPGEPAPPLPALADPAAPCIRILGPIGITGVDTRKLEAGKRRALVELACLLKLKPGRTPDQISRTLGGPRGPWSASTRAAGLSRLRSWLGRDGDERPYFPNLTGGVYALADTIGCDWTDFQALARYGVDNAGPAGTAALHQALDLVRGAPFADAAPERYAWAEPLKPAITAAVADVAHVLATRHTARGEFDAAREVLTAALENDPAAELLHRDLVRLEHRAGDPGAVDRAVQGLTAALDRLALAPDPETRRLVERLRPRWG